MGGPQGGLAPYIGMERRQLLPYQHFYKVNCRNRRDTTLTLTSNLQGQLWVWKIHNSYHTDIYTRSAAGIERKQLVPYHQIYKVNCRNERDTTLTLPTTTWSTAGMEGTITLTCRYGRTKLSTYRHIYKVNCRYSRETILTLSIMWTAGMEETQLLLY